MPNSFCFLTIETATPVCSVALSADGEVLYTRLDRSGGQHAEKIGVFISEAIETLDAHGLTVDAVGISVGPGSYTGLRLGISAAQGLCYGWHVPLITLSSLQVLATQIRRLHPGIAVCPMIDARRMEVFSAIYDADGREIRAPRADIVDATTYASYLDRPILFAGNGAEKCQSVIASPNARFEPNVYPTAEAMIPIVESAFVARDWADPARLFPFYLKDYRATVGRNKVLGKD